MAGPDKLWFLVSTNHRLDQLLPPISELASRRGFETVDACVAEDKARARSLRKLQTRVRVGLPRVDFNQLATLIDTIAGAYYSVSLYPCLASASYVRDRRIGLLGTILDYLGQHTDVERGWITASHPTLCFNRGERWSQALAAARHQLHSALEVSGAATAPGFLISYLSGCYNPQTEKFHLKFRGIAGGDKLARLRKHDVTGDGMRLHRGLRWRTYRITDLPRQVIHVMPNFLPELLISRKGIVTGVRRMSEPYHSIYLAWLSQYCLADMLVTSGACYLRGRLVDGDLAGQQVGKPPDLAPTNSRVAAASSAAVPRHRTFRAPPRRLVSAKSVEPLST